MALTRIKPTSISNSAPFSMSNVAIQGNVDAGNVKTDNLLYANGVAWDLQQPAGVSSHLQFNTNNNFDSSANLTFNKSTKTLTTDSIVANITGDIIGNVTGNVTGNTAGTHTGPVVGNVTGNVTGNTAGTHTGPVVGNVTGNVTGNITGTVLTASQPQITTVGTLGSLAVTNDASVGGSLTVTGNLTVSGTSTVINSTVVEVADLALVLAKNAATTSQANGAGILIGGAGANFTYVSASNSFVSTHRITVDGGLISNVNASNIATGTIPSSILGNSTHFIGTTSIALNRATGAQALTGITSIDGYAPTVSSSSQPNITSVSTSFTGLTFAANGNITMSGSSSQISGGNLVSASYVSGNGTLLSALNASNISSGTIPSSILGNSTVYVGTTGITLNRSSGSQSLTGITSIDGYAPTVSASSQPNITSVGILTSVSVSGNANVANINANTNASFTGWMTSQQSTEILINSGTLSSTSATYNLSTGASFYHSSIASGGNWTANFTNVPTTDGRSIVVTIIAAQGATPYIPNTIQIDGVTQALKWSSGSTPSGTASGVDVFSFALFRAGGAWVQILGSSSFFL